MKVNYYLTIVGLLISILIWDFLNFKKLTAKETINLVPTEITRVNLTTSEQSYPAKARFWGLVANGVNQVSTVTLNSNSNQRLLVTIILPENCRRVFEITETKITKVIHDCPSQKIDESSQYAEWVAFHNATTREVQMIAPPIKVENPLYIRKQAFWLIQY
ncbi:hypothetical protein PCC8801_0583 [Rippkaea orientalis PCC 8801]|uniref:Uncharacterized protein n=1 Tax=Rippkaea orientalis (strain PCC 8801 / RF-1) TaxID=41431 RepID=B7JVV1_RIPO1|nr:hypothetical protein [Rippkaea orientalis]ACK64672.1 hypothetical protein PCC8801_0583 [Rippkaea orientalis PCC 8801]